HRGRRSHRHPSHPRARSQRRRLQLRRHRPRTTRLPRAHHPRRGNHARGSLHAPHRTRRSRQPRAAPRLRARRLARKAPAMAFPLAQRELGRLARSRHIHATRGLLIAAIAALLLAEYIPSLGVRRSVISPEYFGTLIHMACLAVQATVLLVVLPMLTAPLIASERSGRTLSLLLLADFLR